MTENEANTILKAEIVHHPECRTAIEKQMPKKPIFDYNLSDTLSVFHCECGNAIDVGHDIGIMNNNNAPNYCSQCGQKLDWSDGV